MDRIARQNLIHRAECFGRDELERRRAQYKFAHLAKVEAFAWDLELYGQLQLQFNEHIILKGGAAAQLLFPVDLQRNSVDIDVITDLTSELFEDGLRVVSQRLCPSGAICTFKEYVPAQGKDGLRLTRYEIEVPSVCNDNELYGRKDPSVQMLKIDVLFGALPNDRIIERSTPTFALNLDFAPRVSSPDALFGDKLLTLAATTVGIPDGRADDRCKQLYDLHRLVNLDLLEDDVQIQESFKLVMETQHHIRGQEAISLADAVIDVEAFLQDARLLDFHDPLVLWQSLRAFQSNFVGVDARMVRETWAVGLEIIRFLVECLLIQQQDSAARPLEVLKRARELERVVEGMALQSSGFEDKVEHIKKMQERLVGFCQSKKIKASPLRGRSPRRVLWYLLSPDNVDQLSEVLYG